MGRVFVDSCEKLNKISLGALAQRGIVCVIGPGTATGGGVAVVVHCVLYFQTPYTCGLELSQLTINKLTLYTYTLGLGVGFLVLHLTC